MKTNYKSLTFIVLTIFLVSILAVEVSAFAGGDGSSGNPYQITDCAQLQEMNNDLNAYYILTNDIDCSDTLNWNSRAGFVPIGIYPSSPFQGTFDGQEHTITGLFINRPSTYSVGLFGCTVSTTIIKNVGLVNVNILGNYHVGGLAGVNYYGTITNSYATGSVTAVDAYVGGLVAWNVGTITNSYATGSVTGNFNVGGLVGGNHMGTITNSYATGNVTGSDSIGGLAGYNYMGPITNSYATGNVTGSDSIGGLTGRNLGGAITNSYATGSVTGNYYVGGLVGFNYNVLLATITNSYATGNVTGNYCVGGLVGYNWGAITNSYATGSVTGSDSIGGLVGENWGGLVGSENDGTTTNSYWDTETSGQLTSDGGTGKTTLEMMQQSTFIGWDFIDIWAINPSKNNGYPYFLWQITAYNWSGFFQPVDNPPTLNQVNAGRAIPVKFSLNGNMGLNIFEAGYPKSGAIACQTAGVVDVIETTVTAGGSSLTYDPIADQYTYVWKTEKLWSNSCRQLVVKLIDGTIKYANFKFTK